MGGAGHGARGRRLALVLTACLTASAAVAGPANAATAKHPAMFYVGFSKQEITPTQVPFEYLGGEGYQRVGTTVVSPLYVRTIAIAASGTHGRPAGRPVVISSMDSQGWFSGYQAGPGGTGVADYGLDQIRAAAAAAAHVPVQNIALSSTHSHTAPDGLGVWGGASAGYIDQVRSAAIASVTHAVSNMQAAWLRHGYAEGAPYVYNPIPTSVPPDQRSDPKTWPQYTKLTVLEALRWGTETPIVTLFDFGTHPDILEGSPLISPDWPAETIDHISSAYGGDAMFHAGVLGDQLKFPGVVNLQHMYDYRLSEFQKYA